MKYIIAMETNLPNNFSMPRVLFGMYVVRSIYYIKYYIPTFKLPLSTHCYQLYLPIFTNIFPKKIF